uniref:DNA topoisomerase 2 n=2 Tax=Sar TaxID=2698737 RepID=A0A7S3LJY6_9STRA
MNGGQHVNFIADQIASKLSTVVSKKCKGVKLKPYQIKNHLWIFVNALIVNPAFDSQTKETLTTVSSKFGPAEFKPELSSKTLKEVEKSGIVDNVVYWAKAKQMKDLSRKAGAKKSKVTGIDKLDDANNAGGRNSDKCTLILTEGDSAKTLAISGLSVVGRDNYGVFPLKGKLLNVRDASHTQIMKNLEIQNICKIMGLQPGKKYEGSKGLRYGHLMIMTDQDHDGSHIKGLLFNFVHHFWPELLKVPGFLQVFITPIVKATKGKEILTFYTMPEYEDWYKTIDASKWKIKYYKGLGTSTAKEAKEYFANIDKNRIDMAWEGEEGGKSIEMAFSKKKIRERKEWLNDFEPGTRMDFNVDQINYKTFVNNELILFSIADNERSLPSIVDGFKPSQRKVLFGAFKRKLKQEIKVAQLAGYVSEHAAYHHGEMSLSSTIVGMAQTFVGSNNINFLFPSGQFGSRIMGGKDAASSRYIFTKLATLSRFVFHQNDDAILNYLEDDGQSIEPNFYLPIIPTVLVNGSIGIGTGWSTEIPMFNPRDIVEYIRLKIKSQDTSEVVLQPWYRGFEGTIRPDTKEGRFLIRGLFERLGEEDNEAPNTLKITELPVGTWTTPYKQFLEDEKVFPHGQIKDVREHHTDVSVSFTIVMSDELAAKVNTDAKLIKLFKLESAVSTLNMTAFNKDGKIQKYKSAEDIIDEFFVIRLAGYVDRKAHLESVLESECTRLENKARFVRETSEGKISLLKRKKKDLEDELTKKKYFKNDGNFDYLLNMQIHNICLEKVAEIEKTRDAKRQELDTLRSKSAADLWEDDLNCFVKAYDDNEEEEKKEMQLLIEQQANAKGNKTTRQRKKAKTKKEKSTKDKPAKKEKEKVEEDEILSLADRLKKRLEVTPVIQKKGLQKKRAKEDTPKGITPAVRPKDKKTKKGRNKMEEESDDDDFVVDDFEISAIEVENKRPIRRTKAPVTYVIDDSDEEDEEDSYVEENEDDDEDY